MDVKIPKWSFDAALYIAEQRKGKFRNRFPSKKLRDLHNDKAYRTHAESIIGYLGDIAACGVFKLDPVEMFEDMIDATDGLAHRDQFDLFFNGYNIDAKIEDFADYHDKVIDGSIKFKDPYGCRLINANQWEENHGFTDIYIFGCFHPPMSEKRLLPDINQIRWLGYVTAEEVETKEIKKFSPAGGWLPRPAKIIPHSDLHPIEDLFKLATGTKVRAGKKVRDPAVDENVIARISQLSDEIRKIAGRKK